MKIAYDGCTKKGGVREINEDVILMRTSGDVALFMVADGVGGKDNGEIVSGMLEDGFDQWWNDDFPGITAEDGFQRCLDAIKDKLYQINQTVIQRFGEWSAGSTIVLLLIYGSNCAYLSAGDSRIYRMRGFTMRQVTRDDIYENLPSERAKQYSVSAAGKLVSAVGINSNLEFSVRTDVVKSGDRFFLCSDGVYGYIPERRLRNWLIFGSLFKSPKSVTGFLSKEIDRNGAGDNYSMICIRTR